jgi:signal transduction histidine kinase
MLSPSGLHPRRLLFIASLAAVALVGIGSSAYVYLQVDHASRLHVLDRASTIAALIPPDTLRELKGAPGDANDPAYLALKDQLSRVRNVNQDARFVYLIGRSETDGTLFFYADSEPADSEDYSPPGQTYEEATPVMHALFENGAAVTEGPDRDRWGVWMSGYAPVYGASGQVEGLLGIDLPATQYFADIAAYSLLPLLIALLFIVGLVAGQRARSRELRYVEQKAEFLSIASHEIRTPLTGIRWAIEGLMKGSPEGSRQRQVLALVHENCLNLIARINNLLDVTKLEREDAVRLKKEPLVIGPFVEDILKSLALSAEQRGIALKLDPSVLGAGLVDADQQMLHHAFFNLISNAIKYADEGTEVWISYRHDEDMHRFSVNDRGPGIRLEDQAAIFEGYHRTREAVRSGQYGTGLGLYLVKRAAELHGGTVAVESGPESTTFTLSLPA